MVQEKGVKAEVVGHGKGQWGRGCLVGRTEGKILPTASADTDHSRQMKLLLFLKSSRQGATTKFFLLKKFLKTDMTAIFFPTPKKHFSHVN